MMSHISHVPFSSPSGALGGLDVIDPLSSISIRGVKDGKSAGLETDVAIGKVLE